MDPHSRFSPFNSRQPKAGPTQRRTMEAPPLKILENPLENPKKKPSSSRQSSSSASLHISRPIATNSRIKQDEQFRKDMHLAFVTDALTKKARGISDTFDELVDQFNLKKTASDTPSPAPQLRLWIIALSNVVSRLERCHSPLIEAVVSMPWTTMDTSFVKSYTSFIGMLVSAKPEYLGTVLGKLAQGFTYQSGLQALDARFPESSTTPLTRRVVYDRIHYLLRHLLSLVPTLPSTLQPLLVQYFPHKRQSQAAQVTYIRNLLQVMEYCPELADRILATIIDRAIQIDVEIQVEMEELEEQLGQEESEVFDFDPFDTIVGQEGEQSDSDTDSGDGDNLSDLSSDAGGGDDNSDIDHPELETDFKHVHEMVNKLDAILKNVFDYFNQANGNASVSGISTPSSEIPLTPLDTPESAPPLGPEESKAHRRAQFYTLLSIFDRIILRTFKSRYTQFLVFWYASLDPEYADVFQGMLVSKALLEEDQPAVTRAAAASYIASFVSRAQFVDRENTRRVMACLCNFLKNRLDIFDAIAQSGAPPPSMAHHSIFYAVAQAVFLIFCFRWRDLIHDPEEVDETASSGAPPSKWMPELEVLRRVVMSELNPLKMCSSNVVMQFAKVAHSTDFLYCYSIIEANKRSEFAPSSGEEQTNISTHPRGPMIHPSIFASSMHTELNTFFPFDPYKLPRSSAYIQGVYREWSSVAIDEEEEEEDEGYEEGADFVLTQARPVSRQSASSEGTDGLGASFGGMSISPVHPAPVASMPMSVS
ncbi:RNA polymerase I-specific transcription initiation factor RRN3 [Panus rudis PR-1116 ss-1]|nr:RNA polymerase I-specific transcription initiation factor RRN3 [Panus rudis PR-1116 ss-1]